METEEDCTPPVEEPTLEPTLDPSEREGCCIGDTPATWLFCQNYGNQEDCDARDDCDWVYFMDPQECEQPTFTPTSAPTDGCCYGATPQTSTFCGTLDTEDECDTVDVCQWMVTADPMDCELTTTTTESPVTGPTVEPTATPSAWIEGCCSGIDNIDDSWCAQFENGPDCEANPQCWWIDGGMKMEAHNDGVNLTTHSPTVSPTDSTAFPSQIPTKTPSKTPTWSVFY